MNYHLDKIEEILKKSVSNGELTALMEPLKELASQRRYGLVWEEPDNGAYEEEYVASELKHKLPFLKELPSKTVKGDAGGQDHLLIEGDNLHALQALQYTHKGKVDVIYIDPPYNTGNRDFVYNDRYVDAEDSWRHSSWLSFMNKRLKLAKELMTEDGVIFISIDDNEMAQLKLLCDQVFGEQNFISSIIWQKKTGGGQAKYIYEGHEYLLVYSKNKLKLGSLTKPEDKKFPKTKIIQKNGSRFFVNDDFLRRSHGKYDKEFDRRLYYEDIVEVKGVEKKKEVDLYLESGEYVLVDSNQEGKHFVARLENLDTKRKIMYSIYNKTNTASGNSEIEEMFGSRVFDNPKPLHYLKEIIDATNNKKAIVLDFFAGSGTTGQAVMELNKEDGGSRQFILCTNNEISSSLGIDYLVENGCLPPRPAGRRGTIAHKEWLEELSAYQETEEFLEVYSSDAYQELGIARSVTQPRIQKVIEGYTTPGGKEVAGLPENSLTYFMVDLLDSSQDIEYDSYHLIRDTVDLIRIKENLFVEVEQKEFSGIPVAVLDGEERRVAVVLNTDALGEDLETVCSDLLEEKPLILYTSHESFQMPGVEKKELPKELLRTLKFKEEN